MSKAAGDSPNNRIPYILEFERSALGILRDDVSNREKLKGLLEKYASEYARERKSRV